MKRPRYVFYAALTVGATVAAAAVMHLATSGTSALAFLGWALIFLSIFGPVSLYLRFDVSGKRAMAACLRRIEGRFHPEKR